MTRLVSGKVLKTDSANVSADRYQFIEISETEPDLGLPSAIGQVFTSDLNGNRYWVTLDTANVNETSNLYFTNTRAILALDGADVYVGNLISQDLIAGNTLIIRGINVQDEVLAGNIRATGIEGNTLSVSNVFSDRILTDSITSNTWNNLYTSNVAETTNLYYTNARVLAHLAESDVSVQDLTVGGNLFVQGDTTTLNTATLVVEDKNIVLANGAPNATAANGAGITIDGAQANITFNSVADRFDFNKPIYANYYSLKGGNPSGIEIGNLGYGGNTVVLTGFEGVQISAGSEEESPYWDFDVTGNLTAPGKITAETISSNSWEGIYTSNVIENTNLYYTNARVVSAVTPLLTTANVSELDNLYYTNARVDSRISETSINALSDVNYTGITVNGILRWDGNVFVASEDPDTVENSNVANSVLSISNFTTDNLVEGSNLYYTNTRVDAYINDSITTNDITEEDNLYYTNTRVDAYINDFIDTDDITEANNLYYTNTRVDAYINDFIDTDDITEANNLYYTNTRVLSHIAASDIETLNLTVQGNLIVTGNLSYLQVQDLQIEDNMIYLNANSNISNPDLGWAGNYNDGTYAHAGIFRDASDGIFKIYDGYTPEPDESAFINVAHPSFRFANVQAQRFIGRISTLDNHTTDNLAEGTNLYYTNSRVDAYINDSITTNDITEEDNLYYTNSRVDAYINDFIDTDDITEANNLYYTNTRVVSAVTPLLTTANVLELSSNLYYTNARVLAYVETLSIKDLRDVSNIYEANVGGLTGIQTGQALVWDGNVNQFIPVFVNSEIANVADLSVRVLSLENFTTANIAEASSNLYFTNTRVLEALVDSNVIVNNLLVSGDLTVQGNTVTLNVSELVVEDKNITLANGAVSAAFADNSGITIAGANATILYKESGDKFEFNKNLVVLGNVITAVGKSITGANLISTDTLETNLIRTDNISSNTIVITNSATFANVLVEGDLIGNLTGTSDFVATLSNFTTDDLAEGTNLYYTNSRVLSHLAESDVTVQDLLVEGDLTVQGNTTTLNTATLVVEDKNIVLANGAPNPAAADGAGITVQGANAEIIYVSSSDSWTFNKQITANLSGSVTGFVSTLSNFTTDDLAEGSNLYYTNARVLANVSEMSVNVLADVDISGILNGQILAWNGSKFIPGSADTALFSESANVANVANTVTNLDNFTTDNLEEGTNLYYTNSRVRTAFTAGRGIIIQENGTIKAKEETELFNLLINGSKGYYLTDSMESAVTFANVNSRHRYLLRSLHVTNISDDDAFISSNIVYSSGNTIALANKIPIPVGGTLEFIKRTQVFNPGDSVKLKSFDSAGVAANNLISSIVTYETADESEDEAFFGSGVELSQQNSNVLLLDSDKSYSILESIKLVNLEEFTVRAKVFWADANNSPKAYFSYNIPLPPNSSVELLQAPKRIEYTDKVFVSINSNSSVSAFVSGKYGSIFELAEVTTSTVPGNIIVASFSTTEDEGETLYYTVE